MYPNLYYAFKDLFGIDLVFLKLVNTFGFFVAMSFLAAAWILTKELKRKQAQGLLHYSEKIVVTGEPASIGELLIQLLLGFLFGYKIPGVFFIPGALDDPQSFMFSREGSWISGLLVGVILVCLKWRKNNRSKLAKPEKRTVRIWPSDRVGDLTVLALVAGFAGAKVFDNLENWNRFIQDPIGNLLGASGFTFYGGLICAAIAIAIYLRKYRIPFIHVADAIAPALMLAYGLGRIGCQVAGDGDWGIVNTHPKPFSWLPDWVWAYDYAHNVNQEGVPIPGCTWDNFCTHLPVPVFPTPLYESIMALLLFWFLWSIRKRFKVSGVLFSIYLIVNGLERFFIEKIRTNTKYEELPFQPTQAELISLFLIFTGVALLLYANKKWRPVSIPVNH